MLARIRASEGEGERRVGALLGRGCFTRRDFARYALARGLFEAERVGANPFQTGFIGSTVVDTAGVTLLTDWVNGLTSCN